MDDSERRWCLVLPVKPLAVAKSRLGPPYNGVRGALALAFATDTVVAALGSPMVSTVLVVTDDEVVATALAALGADVTGDRPAGSPTLTRGLNSALRHGALVLARQQPDASVGVLTADLPTLRPDALTAVLAAAPAGRAFVRDADGSGTTLLLARDGEALRPRFGTASAAAHARSAHELDAEVRLRRDVDTTAHLLEAAELGVGHATAAVLTEHRHALTRASRAG